MRGTGAPGPVAPLRPVPDPLPAGSAAGAELASRMRGCVRCALAAGRQQVVVGSGPAHSRLMLLGEAPGATEDAVGVPFVGRGGRLLDQLLAEVGLARDAVAVANVVRCRPPGNRVPRPAEVAACRPWLVEQLAAVDPAVLVTLGATAAAWALGRRSRLADLRQVAHPAVGRLVVVTYHPAAAMRGGPAGPLRAALAADLAFAAELAA